MSVQTPAADVDSILTALADRDRRRVLRHFVETGQAAASVDTLVDRIVDRDDRGRRVAVATALHHTTLPHLAAAGFVEYDPRSQVARYRSNAALELALQLTAEREATT